MIQGSHDARATAATTSAGKKLLSFSLWGREPLYLRGAVENARLVERIYPGWVARFYCAPEVPGDVRGALADVGAELVDCAPRSSLWEGLFWRFLAVDDPQVERVLCRDADARLNPREAACVREWEASGAAFHVIRDHPFHHVPILGGTFGCRGRAVDMGGLLASWRARDAKGLDQVFLAERVWPLVRNAHLAHDELHAFSGPRARPFPDHAAMTHGHFVGETIPV